MIIWKAGFLRHVDPRVFSCRCAQTGSAGRGRGSGSPGGTEASLLRGPLLAGPGPELPGGVRGCDCRVGRRGSGASDLPWVLF